MLDAHDQAAGEQQGGLWVIALIISLLWIANSAIYLHGSLLHEAIGGAFASVRLVMQGSCGHRVFSCRQ